MRDLSDIRLQLDEIDDEILALYEKRLELAKDVAEYKMANNLKVFDRQREAQKIESLSSKASTDFSKQGIKELFEQIMSISKKVQYRILVKNHKTEEIPFKQVDSFDFSNARVVYQGVEGAYSQVATKTYFGDKVDSYSVKTFRDAMEEIVNCRADFAVLPIENSTAGAVTQNLDLLREYEVAIIGEQDIDIKHCLLGVSGAKLSDVTTVFSHPQAIMQCDKYLSEHNHLDVIAMENTAVSAKKVCESNDKSLAAIAGAINAQIYGLDILESDIADEDNNTTRFIIISKKHEYLPTAKKVSICFELPNESGTLYRVLSHFIFNGINMTSIESRPFPGKQWEYEFFVDFEGNLSDPAVINALCGINEEVELIKILGNY